MATTKDTTGSPEPGAAEHVLEHIVVPIDGTAESARALPLATELASHLGIPVSIVSVIGDFRGEATERVARLEQVLADVPEHVERKVVQARSPAHAIAEESIDGLVVMATSAQMFDDDGIRGSVAEFVTTAAKSPVIVLGPRCPDDASIDRILVGIDPNHEQSGLTYWSTRLGYQLGIGVDFVHADHDDTADLGPKVRRLERKESETIAERLCREAPGALLAIGSHGHTGWRRITEGSVGAALFAQAAQPIMVLGPNVMK